MVTHLTGKHVRRRSRHFWAGFISGSCPELRMLGCTSAANMGYWCFTIHCITNRWWPPRAVAGCWCWCPTIKWCAICLRAQRTPVRAHGHQRSWRKAESARLWIWRQNHATRRTDHARRRPIGWRVNDVRGRVSRAYMNVWGRMIRCDLRWRYVLNAFGMAGKWRFKLRLSSLTAISVVVKVTWPLKRPVGCCAVWRRIPGNRAVRLIRSSGVSIWRRVCSPFTVRMIDFEMLKRIVKKLGGDVWVLFPPSRAPE